MIFLMHKISLQGTGQTHLSRHFSGCLFSLASFARLAVACLLMSASPVFAGLASLDLPPDTDLQWIGKDLQQNGHRMEVASIDSQLPVTEMVEFYQTVWEGNRSGDTPGSLTEKAGEWVIVSTLTGNSMMVVQLQPNGLGGSSGFLSRMELEQSPVKESQFPEPPVSRKLSSTQSTDFNTSPGFWSSDNKQRIALTSLYLSDRSVPTNFEFYRSEMNFRGWQLVFKTLNSSSAAMAFTRDADAVEVAITQFGEHEQSLVVINELDRGETF